MVNMKINMKFDPTIVMYLQVRDLMLARYRNELIARPTEKFYDMVYKEVMTHVIDGKEPHEQILTAVLNIADDMMAGRDVTMRAGDYIALMNYAREMKVL
jgi:hypothetical protein